MSHLIKNLHDLKMDLNFKDLSITEGTQTYFVMLYGFFFHKYGIPPENMTGIINHITQFTVEYTKFSMP